MNATERGRHAAMVRWGHIKKRSPRATPSHSSITGKIMELTQWTAPRLRRTLKDLRTERHKAVRRYCKAEKVLLKLLAVS